MKDWHKPKISYEFYACLYSLVYISIVDIGMFKKLNFDLLCLDNQQSCLWLGLLIHPSIGILALLSGVHMRIYVWSQATL